MATVEYYFQTKNPELLAEKLSSKLGYDVDLSDAELDNECGLPVLSSLNNWYSMDGFDEYGSSEHKEACRLILESSNYYDDSLESHSSILDSWWRIGQCFDLKGI